MMWFLVVVLFMKVIVLISGCLVSDLFVFLLKLCMRLCIFFGSLVLFMILVSNVVFMGDYLVGLCIIV